MAVGLVIVSHSAQLAWGVVEVARQMAPDVLLVAAGGTADGGVGTDFDAVQQAVTTAAEAGDGVALLYDLGSAQLTAEMVVETADVPGGARVVDAPLVEGAVAGAVAAAGGADLAGVAAAAAGEEEAGPEPATAEHTEDLLLTNEIGLHARPAAMLARCLTGLDAQVTVRHGEQSADAASVLGLMGLQARGGDRVTLAATGPDAGEALRRIHDLAERRFDE